MDLNNRKSKFIEKAILKFNNRFNYSKINYIDMHTKVEIICDIHGSFYQEPNSHIRSKEGCPECAHIIRIKSKTKTTSKFIEQAKNIHGDKYDYSKVNYVDNKTKIQIICKIHGVFEQSPVDHLQRKGCLLCKNDLKRKTTEKFIKEAILVHDNFYNYDFVDYLNNKTKVTICCPFHGKFKQEPRIHLFGKGCLDCGNEKKTENINDYNKDTKTILYFIRIFNDSELFYKIGYTTTNLNTRFSGGFGNNYNFQEVAKKETTLELAIKEEREVKRYFKHLKYTPLFKFPGYTECFKEEVYNQMFGLKR